MLLKPLPPVQEPIAASLRVGQRFYEWMQGIDALLRAPAKPSVQTASYVLAASDHQGIVETSVAGANTITAPANNSVPLPVGFRVTVTQMGAGATTLTADAGVTIRSRATLVLKGQYSIAYLYKRATNEWVASGDLT